MIEQLVKQRKWSEENKTNQKKLINLKNGWML